ncbi:MAG: type 4a pilus biogenesis protein PilO [Methylococcales bacterium]|nr:type 4a pilus biogenesis protein PilO [Methylococcales bacterium]
MDLADIDWDFNAAWSWSAPVRAVVILVSCLVLIGVGVYYDTLDQFAALEVAEKKEAELKTIFELKLNQAANLPAYQEQLKQIKLKLNDIIKQMPMEEEIAGLLIDISQTGIASGLEFKLFKPAPPVVKDFYSELPINIEVLGKYDELSFFLSGLASLPRIVTVHDLTIVPADKTKIGKQSVMLMAVTVKTYRENGTTQHETK